MDTTISNSHTRLWKLLSTNTGQALNIIHFAFSSTFHSNTPDQIPSLLYGKTGKISGVMIRIHISLSAPPMHNLSHAERCGCRNSLERLDVREKITVPTSWVSSVVVVPKDWWSERLCRYEKSKQSLFSERNTWYWLLMTLLLISTHSRYSVNWTSWVHIINLRKHSTFPTDSVYYLVSMQQPKSPRSILGVKNLSDDTVHRRNQETHDRSLRRTLKFSIRELTYFEIFSEKGVAHNPQKAIVTSHSPEKSAHSKASVNCFESS